MGSSNADSAPIDPTEFYDTHNMTPQTYVERVAIGQLRAPKLAAELADLAAAKAALVPGGWEHLTDQRAMQDGADAENLYLSQVSIVNGIKSRQAGARAFAAGGSLGAFRGGLGKFSNVIIDNGQVEFRRIDYDIEAAVRQLQESGIDEESFELAASVLRHGGKPTEGMPG